MVSHEINMVYRYANQILCLNKDLICNGIPKVAITNEVLTKLYGNEVSFREHKH
jgi:zinc transport system ATP-binding protein